jgi:lysophospholipase
LSKLSYLLSKDDLDTTTVRQLMSIPIRGEMTLPDHKPTALSSQSSGLEGVMGHLLHLNASPSTIVNTTRRDDAPANGRDNIGSLPQKIDEHDARLAESLLLPYALCLAAAKDNVASMLDLVRRSKAVTETNSGHHHSERPWRNLIDDLDPAFGKNALHVAADCGSKSALEALLQIGAFVHTRDRAGHTA